MVRGHGRSFSIGGFDAIAGDVSTGSSVKGSIRALSGSGIQHVRGLDALPPRDRGASKKCRSRTYPCERLDRHGDVLLLATGIGKAQVHELDLLSLINFMTSLADIAIAGSPRVSDCWWAYEGKQSARSMESLQIPCHRRKKGRPLCHKRASKRFGGLAHQTAQSSHYAHRVGANQLLPLRMELNYAYRVTTNLINEERLRESILAQANSELRDESTLR